MSHTAVVILNYNGEHLLRQFLPSVIRYSPGAEIVVADNASTDASVQVMQNEFPGIRLIILDKNYGYCGGYNRALQQVTADYYVLLNSDIEVTPGWLTPLTTLLDNDTTIAAAQPKVLSFHQKTMFEHAGAGGGLIDTLGYPFCRGRLFDHIETDTGQYNDTREVFWATGACLVVRAKAYHTLGGLDEDFFAHMEEIDLCWKLHRAHYRVYYCGDSTIYHVGAGTLGYNNPRKTYLNFRNGLWLVMKHWSTTALLFKLPVRVALDWVASLVYLLKGQPANSGAVWKAHGDALKGLGNTWRKRKKIITEYPDYSRAGIYKGSIVFDYYIRKKRTIG